MKKLFILGAIILLATGSYQSVSAQSILERAAQKAKEKMKDRTDQKVDQTIEKGLDALEGIFSGKKNKGGNGDATGNAGEAGEMSSVRDAKDFVRGSVILFQDDFSGDPVGEFPAHWDLVDGTAEVVTLGGVKCLQTKAEARIIPLIEPDIHKYLSDEFTLEFKFYGNGLTYPDHNLSFQPEFFSEEYNGFLHTEVHENNFYYGGKIQVNVDWEQTELSLVEDRTLKKGWHTYQLSYNKGAMKCYIDGVRVLNAPREPQPLFFQLYNHGSWGTNYFKDFMICLGAKEKHEGQATNITSNVTPTPAPAAQSVEQQMQQTGKFVTNNIFFETGKADLKIESMVEIVKVAEYMKANPNVRFEVQGHCDNQGSDKVNDPLSQARAEAIVKALVSLGVDEWNLRAVGKGSHEPVADNSTEFGRALNRRVEFIKK